jgi:hypothetical protein
MGTQPSEIVNGGALAKIDLASHCKPINQPSNSLLGDFLDLVVGRRTL